MTRICKNDLEENVVDLNHKFVDDTRISGVMDNEWGWQRILHDREQLES